MKYREYMATIPGNKVQNGYNKFRIPPPQNTPIPDSAGYTDYTPQLCRSNAVFLVANDNPH